MKTRLLIIIGITLSIIFVIGLSLMFDFRHTGNPNECWYQDDDEIMMPCKINSTGPSMVIGMGLVIFWPYIILGIVIAIIFIVWRKRK